MLLRARRFGPVSAQSLFSEQEEEEDSKVCPPFAEERNLPVVIMREVCTMSPEQKTRNSAQFPGVGTQSPPSWAF